MQPIEIVVDRSNVARADDAAAALEQALKRDGMKVERKRNDKDAQDFGATLVLVLGAPAVVKLAKTLHDWAARTNQASIAIKTDRGEITIKNLNSGDVSGTVTAISSVLH